MRTAIHGTVAAFVLLMFLAMSGAAYAAKASVTVAKMEGKVEWRASADGAWKPAAQGGKLSAGAFVRTGPASSCVILWGGGNVVKLQALTNVNLLTIDRDDNGKENSAIDLKIGKVNAHVAKLNTAGSSFSVKTPAAVAGVRGTDLLAQVAPDNSTVIGVTDGEVYVEMDGVQVTLTQDLIVNIGSDGQMGEPMAMPQEMKSEAVEQMNQAKQDAKSEEGESKGTGSQDKGKGAEQGKGIEKQETKEGDKQEGKDGGEKGGSGEKGTESAAAPASGGGETSSESGSASSADWGEASDAPAADTAQADAPTGETVDTSSFDIADVTSSVINDVMDQQLSNEILGAAEEAYRTGQFEIEIIVEP